MKVPTLHLSKSRYQFWRTLVWILFFFASRLTTAVRIRGGKRGKICKWWIVLANYHMSLNWSCLASRIGSDSIGEFRFRAKRIFLHLRTWYRQSRRVVCLWLISMIISGGWKCNFKLCLLIASSNWIDGWKMLAKKEFKESSNLPITSEWSDSLSTCGSIFMVELIIDFITFKHDRLA